MKIEVYADAESVAQKAAELIAAEARMAVATRGSFVMAVSGGHTPWLMLRDLAKEEVPWNGVHVVQVDERVAPPGDADRNLTHLRESLLEHAPLHPEQIHAMRELEPFERFVFVMSVLERYSDHDCALLLGCACVEILPARIRAFRQISRLGKSYPNHGSGDQPYLIDPDWLECG